MKIRLFSALALTTALLLPAAPVAAAPAVPVAARSTVAACQPATPAQGTPTTQFYDGQPALGPDPLPTAAPVGPLLYGYQRFGALTQQEFLAKYRNGDSWIYPPADGFLVIGGYPIKFPQTLKPGSRIDRFGYAGGSYLAPEHSLFTSRALPPQNLNTPAGTPQSNYHLYCVAKEFKVAAGVIAPWFEQTGLGIQYKLESAYLPAAGSALSVTWLLQNGYLVEEKPA